MLCMMSLINRLERRCGWLAFPGFLRFFVILHALVFVLQIFRPDLIMLLEFHRGLIMEGEVWRVVTFLFASTKLVGSGGVGLILMFFVVMIAFMISDALEGAWGVFRTSLFHYAGILGLVAANFLVPYAMLGSGVMIYLAAFLAFATLFPKVEFLVMFIIPVQVRLIAWLICGVLVFSIFSNFRLLPFFTLSLMGYFFAAGLPALRGTAQVVQSAQRRRKFQTAKEPEGVPFHVCETCKRTDQSDPQLEFRVGGDGREYCEDHLPD